MVKQENGKGAAVSADDMDEDVAGALSQSQTETSPAWAELVSLNDSWQNFPLTVDMYVPPNARRFLWFRFVLWF